MDQVAEARELEEEEERVQVLFQVAEARELEEEEERVQVLF